MGATPHPDRYDLAPEGGAHQSITTPSIGLEQPVCIAWEPAFAEDFEWCMLETMGQMGRPGGESAHFRISPRPIDQRLAPLPEVMAFAERLARRGVSAGVVCFPSPDLVFRSLNHRYDVAGSPRSSSAEVAFPAHARTPVVTVLDGHQHTLAFLAATDLIGFCR
ncbi:hypothetical protein FB472_2686 [Rhodoglobus vestalii]|uniref:Uncharacterized protein n=1 Tax=Rhodoglobus vestalii TaxID=193384 RepID=A0A8H2K9C0_9MICO|nr:hypothetical protein FB472_2686 [Rhodoglobus vestalii]